MLYIKISDDMKTAMKAKDAKTLEVLRMMKSKIMTVNARGEISDEEIIKILNTYEKNLKDALKLSEDNNRIEAADELKVEIEVVARYLPKKLSKDETIKIVAEVIAEMGATSKQEMGKVMGGVMKKGLPVDSQLVKEIVESKLN
ncbi:MAG: GatB/YqeY domain-containing protein [Candidatus Margulisbacteria bacterium]|nr:GatB/YqeY domain-containing protein [Candidatus Margulisiibacteriota bacterium]